MVDMEIFDAYFMQADLDRDGRISGSEAVTFFKGSNLPKQILAQIWMQADQNRTGFLDRAEFYNALKLVTVAQSGRQLTPDMVKAALTGPAFPKIPAPKIYPLPGIAFQMTQSGSSAQAKEDLDISNRVNMPEKTAQNESGGRQPSTPNEDTQPKQPSDDEHAKSSIETPNFLAYSFAEIKVATNGLSESSKIGKGGYGSVYKGKLRGTIVAIKILDSHGSQSKREFFQELDVLCQMRHQNLVNLIGACFESYALVYEFVPNGSLEYCLKNCSSLLTWKIRTRIIYEICSSLKFLHSRSVVHGDIKPDNVLLDTNFNGKLADFGLCRFLPKGTTTVAFLETNPKGTLEYIDLKFLETGILRPSSDLYSFGVMILKLVTGQRPLGLSRRVYDADENTFREMIDATAGPWPFELAQELAHWGLQCCYHNEESSQLMNDMWISLKDMLDRCCIYI